MDDTEDDARYPPNPHPHRRHHHHHHHHQHKLPIHPSHAGLHRRRYPRGGVEDEVEEDGGVEESEEEAERNEMEQSMEDAEDEDDDVGEEEEEEEEDDEEEDDEGEEDGGGGGGYRRVRAEEPFKRRRKRRRLDRLALGFEFAPRVAAASAAPPAARPLPPLRNSLADWTEDSTFVLLDAWGELFLQNGRKSLRSDEWVEVAKKVSQSSRTARSEAQCRNRLDTLKKKYKKEKSRMTGSSNSSSKWVYFTKMEALMASPPPPPAATRQQPRLPCGFDSGEYVFMNSKVYVSRSNDLDEMRDSPGDSECEEEEEDDESDGLPPERAKAKGNSDSSSFRMLAESIQKFGEIYEKIENSKQQHMAELERMRKEFHRDLEIQKRQILERAQAEIAKIRQGAGEDDDDDGEEQEDEDINNEDEEIDGSLEDGSS